MPSRLFIWTCRLLCLTALGISGYLAWTAFQATEVYGCGSGEVFDCGHVLTSQYAKVLGIPVSVPAFGMYAGLLAVLSFFRTDTPSGLLRVGWAALTVGSGAAALAALWFVGIQLFELQHLCAYCIGAHTCGLLLAAIIFWNNPFGWKVKGSLSTISVAGVAGLITTQLLTEPPPTFTVERFDDDESAELVSADDSTEFGAPMEFAAPGAGDSELFAAPGTDDAELFAPPVAAPSAATTSEFLPPAAALAPEVTEVTEAADSAPVVTRPSAVTTSALTTSAVIESHADEDDSATVAPDATKPASAGRSTGVQAAPAAEQDESDAAAEKSQKVDVTVPEQNPAAIPATRKARAVAAAAFLFVSPPSASLAVRLFSTDESGRKESDQNQTTTDESDESSSAEAEAKAEPVAPPERLVSVSGNRFSLNSRHWPLLGNPDAKYIFVEMFDYTCPHCRNTHRAIDGAFERLGDDLAVIALPVPLDGSCNDTVRSTSATHRNACELARLSVAVWRVDREQFRVFHDWLFDGTRSSSAARAKAEQLVGKDRLAAELALPHASDYIAKHVELYKRVGRGSVPKLMFPRSTMTGEVSSISTLCSTIQRELGD
ncbi:MAG: vitamin K epoxide reductase family protein [Fuerstiella sp.]